MIFISHRAVAAIVAAIPALLLPAVVAAQSVTILTNDRTQYAFARTDTLPMLQVPGPGGQLMPVQSKPTKRTATEKTVQTVVPAGFKNVIITNARAQRVYGRTDTLPMLKVPGADEKMLIAPMTQAQKTTTENAGQTVVSGGFKRVIITNERALPAFQRTDTLRMLQVPRSDGKVTRVPLTSTDQTATSDQNRLPIAIPDVYTTPRNTALVVPAPGVLANDYDPDGDAISFAIVQTPANGTLSGAATDGRFTYTPNAGFSGVDAFTYRIIDANGNLSVESLISVLVIPDENRAPVAVPDVYTTPGNTALVVPAPGVLANDYDPDGDAISFAIVQTPANGTLSGAATDGRFTYTPDPGFSGTDAFSYRIIDANGNLSVESLITVLVLPDENRAPVAVPDVYTTPGNTALVVSAPGVLANDYDPDGDAISFAIVQTPANGTLSGAATDGRFTYTPNAGFSGVDAFSYRIIDANGNLSVESLISVLVIPDENRAPVAVPDVYTTPGNTALVVPAPGVLANDYDPDGDAISFAIVQTPANGTLSGAATDGRFTYTPDPGFSGTDAFSYRIIDANGNLSVESLITVLVLPDENRAPVAVPDVYTTPGNTALVVPAPGVLANDYDPDGDAISFAIVQTPANGTLSGAATDGRFTYIPNTGFSGVDAFTYRIIDAKGNLSVESLIIVYVLPSQPPVADAGPDQTVEATGPDGASVQLDGSASSDPDGDALSFSWSLGNVEIATGETPTVTVPLGINTITLTVTDSYGLSNTDEVIITVEDTTPPVITIASSPMQLWPPNHRYRTVNLSKISFSAADLVDTDLSGDDVVLSRVWSDEPENASGEGNTFNDILLSDGCRSVSLRAERNESGNGRVYTLELSATDASGNTGTATYRVEVPIALGTPAQDDGAVAGYTVTGDCNGTLSQGSSGSAAKLLEKNSIEAVRSRFALEANYPNPFHLATEIAFSLPRASVVRVVVYDLVGREVRRLVDGEMTEGRHVVQFVPGSLPSGIYLYRMEAGPFIQMRRMVYLK